MTVTFAWRKGSKTVVRFDRIISIIVFFISLKLIKYLTLLNHSKITNFTKCSFSLILKQRVRVKQNSLHPEFMKHMEQSSLRICQETSREEKVTILTEFQFNLGQSDRCQHNIGWQHIIACIKDV